MALRSRQVAGRRELLSQHDMRRPWVTLSLDIEQQVWYVVSVVDWQSYHSAKVFDLAENMWGRGCVCSGIGLLGPHGVAHDGEGFGLF